MTTLSETDPFLEENLQNCKKCNLPIYEGHAYELGDDRWHINCFKCSKCNSSLGCNSNFLVLGNGNLICSNCSYNCKQCGKKIDDLAILTGDQAYCSSCFKCRACKQKIEDLRYARTSKGLFCMSCHEKLMAKKRKYDQRKKGIKKPLKESNEKIDDPYHNKIPQAGLENNGSTSTVEVSTPLMNELEEKPLFQPRPQPASGLQSQSELYDLYDRSRSPTPKLNSKHSSVNELHLHHDITRSSSAFSKDKDLPITPETEKEHQKFHHAKPPPPPAHHESKKSVIEREFSIEEINDSDDELSKRNEAKGSKSPDMLQPAVDLNQHNLKPTNSPASISHTMFQGKNLLILSPSQNSSKEEDLRSPKSPDHLQFHDTLLADDNLRSRSNCPSPLARNNRHARVMEDNNNENLNNDADDTIDGISGENVDVEELDVKDDTNTTIESSLPEPISELTTPKRKNPSGPHNLTSPPPRVPLPSVPSNPNTPGGNNRNSQLSDHYFLEKAINNEEFLGGLGLEGIDYTDAANMQNKKRSNSNQFLKNSKVVVNPTPTVTNLESDNNDDEAGLSRKQSVMRTPRLGLRHKRSISGGSHSAASSISKLNIFKSRDDRGHSRHVSEGSIGGGNIMNGNNTFMAPGFTMALHSRSNSDTNYINHKGFEFSDNISGFNDVDLRSLKLEISLLEVQKQNLLMEVRKLQEEKSKLGEDVDILRAKYNDEFRKFNTISKEVNDLRVQKRDLDPKSTPDDSSHFISHHSSQSSSSLLNNTTDITTEESIETQKATKLKFWRRAKIGFNNANANGASNNGGAPNLMVPSGSFNLASPNKSEEDTSKKNFMTKSRSTNILDTFLNGNSQSNESQTDNETSLFNSSIEKRAKFENNDIPLIITRCIKEVEERGLDMEGIYRISGGNLTIIAIEQAFSSINPKVKDDKNMNKLNEVLDCDINAITSALKRYLRKIPDPLIPFDLYNDFIKLNSISTSQKKITEFKSKIIDKLPNANRQVLLALSKHLNLVASYDSVNRMNYKNLSVVFAPTIARDETGQREMLDMGSRNDMTEFFLTNSKEIFGI